jgi:hypothetical protein
LRNDSIAAATGRILDSPYDCGLAECAGNRREDESHLIHLAGYLPEGCEEEVQHKCPLVGRGRKDVNSISTIDPKNKYQADTAAGRQKRKALAGFRTVNLVREAKPFIQGLHRPFGCHMKRPASKPERGDNGDIGK